MKSKAVGLEEMPTNSDDATLQNRWLPPQPRGFWPLSSTEFWERFSYYGLQGSLTYYLLYSLKEGGLALDPSTAVAIVGVYGGGVYLTQILGAWLADRVISPRSLILYGGILIACGHLSLAVLHGISGVITGLVFITVGTGAMKANITSLVGMTLKSRGPAERDAGFSFYYMCINAGAVIGPLLTGLFQSKIGFHAAFGLAAVGMVASLVQYLVKWKSFPVEASMVKDPADPRVVMTFVSGVVAVAGILAWLLATGVLSGNSLNNVVGLGSLAVVTAYFVIILTSRAATVEEKRGVAAYIPLWIGETIYYGLILQIFTTVPLFVTARVDLNMWGWSVPVAWFLTGGTIAAIAMQGLMATAWQETRVGRATVSAKFRLGLFVAGLGYVVLLVTNLFPAGKTVSPLIIFAFVIVSFTPEAFVGPIGFSVVAKVGPDKYRTQLFALKLLAVGVASSLSTVFANLYLQLGTTSFFLAMGAVGVLSALALWPFSRAIDGAINAKS